MSKKRLLNIAAGLFLVAAVVLLFWQLLFTDPFDSMGVRLTGDPMGELAQRTEVIERLKTKCGFETKIENEDSCFCEVERKTNLQIDEIEELVRKNPDLAKMNVLMGSKQIPVPKLSELRLPISPECQ